jgi:hypothetical protein
MKIRLQRLFGLHLATVLLVVAGSLMVYVANTWPSPRLLGHVSSSEPPIAPGLWIHGDDYGWPWVYQTESFKTKDIVIKSFDRFEWKNLIANAMVGLAINMGIGGLLESVLRRRAALRGGLPTT